MRIAVIGAGNGGVGCALHLRCSGHDVTPIDPHAPGIGTSFGSAGGIVAGAVFPNSRARPVVLSNRAVPTHADL